MCNKFIRNSCLLACVSFTLSNAYAMDSMDVDPSAQVTVKPAIHAQIPEEERWKVTEYRQLYAKNFSKSILFEGRAPENFINSIFIGEVDQKNEIYIMLNHKMVSSQETKNLIHTIERDLHLNNMANNIDYEQTII